jgi:CHAT domain-containing protein/Tfp pilus assembly protein PilF
LSREEYYSQFFKLRNENKFKEALDLAKRHIEQDPEDCRAYHYLAVAGAQNQKWASGILSYLDRLQEGNPGNGCVAYARAWYFASQGQYERAQDYFQKAINLNPEYSGSYVGMGWIHFTFRKYEEARKSYEHAIGVAKAANDPIGEAEARIELATLYWHRGDPGNALKHLSEALDLSKRSPYHKAKALTSMAVAYLVELAGRTLNELNEAETKCNEAIEIHQSLKDDRLWYDYATLAELYTASGDVRMASGDLAGADREYRKAIDSCQQALKVAKRPEHLLVLRSLYLGYAYLKLGEQETALQHYKSFFSEAMPKENPSLKEYRGLAAGYIGRIYLDKRQYEEALDYLNRAAAIAEGSKNKRLEMSWLKQIGDVYAGKADYAAARAYYDKVLNQAKDGFLKVGPQEEEYLFFENTLDVYEAVVDLLVKMAQQQQNKDYIKEAFDYLERSRTQSILQVLFQSQIVERLLQEKSGDEFRERLKRLRDTVETKHRSRLEKLAGKMKNQNPDEIKHLENEARALEEDIESSYRQMVNLIKGKLNDYDTSRAVDKMQKQVLKENETLIEYMVTEEKTFVFLISQKGFDCEVIPVGRNAYKVTPSGRAEPVQSLRQLMRKVSRLFPLPDEDVPKRPRDAGTADVQLNALHDLYKTIFQPIEKYLRPGSQLIIIPDDVLYYLPFEMLVSRLEPSGNPKHLLSQYPISYSYSANLLLELPKTSDTTLPMSLLVANPDFGQAARTRGETAARSADQEVFAPLRYSEEEVNKIRKIIKNPVTLVGTQATEAAFKRKAPEATIIHLATHSVFDRRNYLDSKIVFALGDRVEQQGEDGMLYLHEIMSLSKLKAHMVILTGCETSLGRLRRGGGLEGISRAFLSVGVPSVIGTLWPVADSESTANLMAGFYKYLAKGLDKRQALQKAKLDLIAEDRYMDPFYWAAPILIGDTHPVEITKNQWPLTVVIISSLALFFLIYFIRYRRARKKLKP